MIIIYFGRIWCLHVEECQLDRSHSMLYYKGNIQLRIKGKLSDLNEETQFGGN